jgi:hypothetical protein
LKSGLGFVDAQFHDVNFHSGFVRIGRVCQEQVPELGSGSALAVVVVVDGLLTGQANEPLKSLFKIF